MTRSELVSALADAGVEAAAHEANVLLEEFFGFSPAAVLADAAREYDDAPLLVAIERRKNREPLQYVVGKAYFCNEVYYLNENCLIPRADTELLVFEAARLLPKNARLADLFCGSGCVGISLLKTRGDCTGVGVDISSGALEMARKNARENGVSDKISFICDDVRHAPLGDEVFDVITANPPYITEAEMAELSPEVLREPRLALYGGKDGLDLFSAMLEATAKNLSADGYILCEIGWKQGEDAKRVAASYGFDCEILCDLSGNPRVAKMKKRI